MIVLLAKFSREWNRRPPVCSISLISSAGSSGTTTRSISSAVSATARSISSARCTTSLGILSLRDEDRARPIDEVPPTLSGSSARSGQEPDADQHQRGSGRHPGGERLAEDEHPHQDGRQRADHAG